MSPRFDSLITTMGLMLDGDTTTAKWRAIISGLLLDNATNKFEKYRQFSSLMEYTLINPGRRKTEIFRREGSGHWVLYEFGKDEPVTFASLGLTIESTALYEKVD